MKLNRLRIAAWTGILCLVSSVSYANPDESVGAILAKGEAPAGVLFEVVQADPAGLDWAIPKIRGYIDQLRARFPGVPVAVISHGFEQFSLLSENSGVREGTHALARSLLAEEDIPVQVCGNHAGMYGHRADDYPDYVEVVDAAPRQVRRYRERGYEVIVVTRQ